MNKNCWHIVCGLKKPDRDREEAILAAFWERFRASHENHPVFAMAEAGSLNLGRCAPLVYHGDEGRGRRRNPFLVTSFFSILGRGIQPGLAQKAKKKYLKLLPNFQGHTYTTRFLQATFPKEVYQQDAVFQALLENVVVQADLMATSGVQNTYRGDTYHAIVLGISGDWSWLIKAGNMSRNFNHTIKHPKDTPSGICHICEAGEKDHPFEQIHVRSPSWLSTCYRTNAFKDPSPLLALRHVPDQAASLFRFDLWHSWHLGVGKAFVGSAIALLSATCPGNSKDQRMDNLNTQFMAWCKQNSKPPILTRLSKETIGWGSNSNFPVAGWFKGSLTTTFCEFICHKLGGGSDDPWLRLAGQAAVAIHDCISGLYKADAFLTPEQALELGEFGLRFLRRYAELARLAAQAGRPLWVLLPKLHILQHIFLQDLVLASRKYGYVLNPVCWSVQMSEDFIGRNSRVARKVHPSKCAQRCLERHLALAYSKYIEAGYLIPENH